MPTEAPQANSSSASTRSATSTLGRIASGTYFHFALLLALVLFCFGKTLTGYFLADDFGEVSYVSRIFSGEPQLFWSNFTGNFMQVPGMNVYRPYLLVSLVLDFLLYRTNAVGYYATNLLYFLGDVLLVYAIAGYLTRSWTAPRAAFAAIASAALFAANPLRCESVTWVVGRVDIICCFYYLLSLYLFLRSRLASSAALKVFGTLSFAVALGTKEMAVGLPIVLFLVELLNVDGATPEATLSQRCRRAALYSAPLWGCLALYFVIRLCCLGTLGGGYVAGFGASQLSLMVQRWLDIDTVKRFFYPFNSALFPHPGIYAKLLSLSYAIICGALCWKLFTRRINIRMALFLVGWIATAIVPIFQLWGLGLNLEGARFYFFMSVPLMLMAPLLLLEPVRHAAGLMGAASLDHAGFRPKQDALILKMFACASALLLLVMVKITGSTDMEWVRAGREVKETLKQAQELAQTHSGRIVLFGIPKDRSGAHQILNGITFLKAVKSPFIQQNLDDRFVTFDPIMYGPDEYINAQRLKRVEASKDFAGSFIWSGKEMKFRSAASNRSAGFPFASATLPLPVNLVNRGWLPYTAGHAQYKIHGNEIELIRPMIGDGIQIQDLSVNPNQFDFLSFEYKADIVPPNAVWRVMAEGNDASAAEPCLAIAAMQPTAGYRSASIRLSRYWRWFTNGSITGLTIEPGSCANVTLRNLQLIPAYLCAPKLSPQSATENGAGFIELQHNESLALVLDKGKIPGATGFQIEIGKPNFFFENFDESSKVDLVKERISCAATGGASASLTIPPPTFPTAGFCQLRTRCVTSTGEPTGQYSDTLTVKIIQ